MVTAMELNVNRQLDEAKIKAMTGGEPITARHLYKNFAEFKPRFKLWLGANDRPRVRATDDAIWRRIRVIPMNVQLAPDEIDPDLPLKLKAEWPGILSSFTERVRRDPPPATSGEPLVARRQLGGARPSTTCGASSWRCS